MRHEVHAAVMFRVKVVQCRHTHKFGATDCLYLQHADSQFLKMLVQHHCQHYTIQLRWYRMPSVGCAVLIFPALLNGNYSNLAENNSIFEHEDISALQRLRFKYDIAVRILGHCGISLRFSDMTA
jgi:hypothetical protein